MMHDTDVPHQPNILQQPRSSKSQLWKVIFIPLLIPLLMLNLAPIAVVLFASNNEYSTFAGLALIPSLSIASIVDLIVFSGYIVTHQPKEKTKILSFVVLILVGFAIILTLTFIILVVSWFKF